MVHVNSSTNAQSQSKASTTLTSLRGQLSPLQQKLLDQIWSHFDEKGNWQLARVLHSRHDTAPVQQALSALGGCVVYEENNQYGQSTYQLSLLGALLSSSGTEYQRLLCRFFELQRKVFKTEPEKQQLTAQQVAAALQLSTKETELLGKLLFLGTLCDGSSGKDNWSVNVMKEAESFPPEGDLSSQVEEIVLRGYRRDAAVLQVDRMKRLAEQGSLPGSFGPQTLATNSEREKSSDADPLKRRYQVFVSSTYADLIEERKHVMQALLVTKCIPSGMELFPAASTEQWNLIKRVIDDCDYYVVIVAGRYGSVGRDGISYTEKEFDYALKSGKPILGFYHSDIRKLTGEKLEETDESKRKLAAFTEKVKQRMCCSWSTPEGLESALKSAIINAIETDPKPGWVRANDVPSWSLVKGLRERIVELESRPQIQTGQKFAGGEEQIEIPAQIRWEEFDDPKDRWGGKPNSMQHTFVLAWDEALLLVAPKPGDSTNRHGLLRGFTHALAKRLEQRIQSTTTKHVTRLDAAIDGRLFDQMLQTFIAHKLLKPVPRPKGIRRKAPYLQLSPKGIQRIAELQAIAPAKK